MRPPTGWRTCWPARVWARGSVWRCCLSAQPRRSWRCWRCSRPGRPICRSTRACRRRGSGSCSPMPRRSPRSPPPGLRSRLDGCDLLVIDVERSRRRQPSPAPRCRRRRADDIAYLIYTSGTTGVPKGVARHPPQRDPAAGVISMPVCRVAAGVDAVSFVGLRRLGVGDLGLRCSWWAAGGGARVGGALTGRLPRPAGRRTGQRAYPDPVGGGGARHRRGWSRRRWWSAARRARPRWWIGGRRGG